MTTTPRTLPRLDLDFVRPHFPALRSGWALFDNAGGSVLPATVIEATRLYMQDYQVQLGASYGLSRQASSAVEQGMASLAQLFGVDAQRILVGPSTTMNVYLLAQALAPQWQAGDEIIISELDHEANRGAWSRLGDRGITVRSWPLNRDTAGLELAALSPLLNSRTRLVCFTHCANVVGAITDIEAITEAVHAAGARVCVDGVAYAPHRALQIDAWNVDIYLTSLYKIFAPHLGAAIIKPDLFEQLRGQNHYFVEESSFPYKLQPGNVNHELVASLVGTGAYFEALLDHHGLGTYEHPNIARLYDLFALHEAELAGRLLNYLRDHPRVRIIGPSTHDPETRVATIAFTAVDQAGKPRQPQALVEAIDQEGVAMRHGDFYARRAIEALGLAEQGGVLRASMVHYNTLGEVERLIAALDRQL